MSQLKKYRKVKYLGKGSYGAAILVELRADASKKFVIKEIVIGHLRPEEQQSAKNEAEVLHQMNHSNITMYIESFVENSKLYIVMEHADGGDLSSAVQKRKSDGKHWDEEELMRIFVQICLALKHVHDQNILHRDLKSQNIFLTQKGMVKLGDFGIAKVLDASEDQARTQIGTPYYLSPEICESQPYGRKSDVWSLGVILFELIALEMPFQAQSLPALVHKIVSQEPNYAQIENRYSAKLLSLCRTLLQKNPDMRPTVAQIVKNDYIKDHISRLLSYTLKAGNGGVLGDIPSRPSEIVRMDPEEADRRIELSREKEREQLRQYPESKEAQLERERQSAQAKKEEEKEKLRKFREDMARKRRDADAKDPSGYGRDRSRSPIGSRQGGDRSRSPVGNRSAIAGSQRDRSRSPHTQDRNRIAAGPGGASSVFVAAPKSNNPYQRNNGGRSPTGPSAQAQAQQAYRGRRLADIQAQRQQDSHQTANTRNNAVTVHQPGNAYEDAARREYFASRAAAQAVKAKVEALERHGSNSSASHSNISNPQRRPSNGGGADNFADMDPESRIAMIKAQREREKLQEIALKEQQMKAAIEQNREDRRRFEAMRAQKDHSDSHSGRETGSQDAATRRSKGSIAFDIDLRSDDAPNLKRNNNNPNVNNNAKHSRWSIDREDTVPAAAASAAPRRPSNGGGIIVNMDADLVSNNKVTPTNEKGKKGWGPPVEAKDILQAYNRKPSMEAFSGVGDSEGETGFEALDDDSVVSNKNREDASEARVTEGEEVVLKRLENKRRSDMAMREQALEVMAKLREKKMKEAKLKKTQQKYGAGSAADAKQYPVISPVKKLSSGARDRAQSPKLMDVLNSIDAAREFVGHVAVNRSNQNSAARRIPAGGESPVRGGDAKRSRLVEYEDQEEVRQVRALDGENGKPPSRRNSHTSQFDEKEHELERRRLADDDAMETINNNNPRSGFNNDDELDTNLATWLQEQKRGVTMRKKPGAYTSSYGDESSTDASVAGREQTFMTVVSQAETVRDDDQVAFYSTDKHHFKTQQSNAHTEEDVYEDEWLADYSNMTMGDGTTVQVANAKRRGINRDASDAEGSNHRPLRAKFANGEDADVIGMQCMLAQALIDDDGSNGFKHDDD